MTRVSVYGKKKKRAEPDIPAKISLENPVLIASKTLLYIVQMAAAAASSTQQATVPLWGFCLHELWRWVGVEHQTVQRLAACQALLGLGFLLGPHLQPSTSIRGPTQAEYSSHREESKPLFYTNNPQRTLGSSSEQGCQAMGSLEEGSEKTLVARPLHK